MMYEQVDLTKLVQLNEGNNGIFFLGDPETGKIYGSDNPLSMLWFPAGSGASRGRHSGMNEDLGWIMAVLPVVTAVAPAVLGLFSGKQQKDQANTAAEIARINAQSAANQQAASMQMLLIGGGLLVGGVVLYSVLN